MNGTYEAMSHQDLLRTYPQYMEECIQELSAHLTGHVEPSNWTGFCSHCAEEWELRAFDLGIEDVNLYDDHLRKEAEEYNAQVRRGERTDWR